MPKKMLPSVADFEQFSRDMQKYGFRAITKPEFFKSFQRLGLRAPRRRLGREAGFIFSANGLNVYVWTTFLMAEQSARDEDAGWVLITKGDKAEYFLIQ